MNEGMSETNWQEKNRKSHPSTGAAEINHNVVF